jgi:hypothetical protein
LGRESFACESLGHESTSRDANCFSGKGAGGREQARLGACATGIIESGLSLNIELSFDVFCELDVPG